MNTYFTEYQRKLTDAEGAAGKIENGNTIVHGLTIAEPPALLAAIANRARAGSLRDLKVYSLLPLSHAAPTVLVPELSDCIQAYSWFVGAADRARVKVGLDYVVPNYFHQIPRL